jgi:hypothetical protein
MRRLILLATAPMATKPLSFFMVVVFASLLALAVAGCASAGKPASASFASVIIKGHSPQEIAVVTARVFHEDGYSGGGGAGGQMVFLKEGSRLKNLAYEGVVGTHYGQQAMMKVTAEILPLDADSHRLQCQAYIIKDAGDAFFREEQRMSNLRSGHYRALLKKVAEQLKSTTISVPPSAQ